VVGVVVMMNNQPPSKTSMHARFRGWWGVVVMKNNQSPSKMSMCARFRGWWGGGDEKQPTTIKNKHACSFLRVVQSAICQSLNSS